MAAGVASHQAIWPFLSPKKKCLRDNFHPSFVSVFFVHILTRCKYTYVNIVNIYYIQYISLYIYCIYSSRCIPVSQTVATNHPKRLRSVLNGGSTHCMCSVEMSLPSHIFWSRGQPPPHFSEKMRSSLLQALLGLDGVRALLPTKITNGCETSVQVPRYSPLKRKDRLNYKLQEIGFKNGNKEENTCWAVQGSHHVGGQITPVRLLLELMSKPTRKLRGGAVPSKSPIQQQ